MKYKLLCLVAFFVVFAVVAPSISNAASTVQELQNQLIPLLQQVVVLLLQQMVLALGGTATPTMPESVASVSKPVAVGFPDPVAPAATSAPTVAVLPPPPPASISSVIVSPPRKQVSSPPPVVSISGFPANATSTAGQAASSSATSSATIEGSSAGITQVIFTRIATNVLTDTSVPFTIPNVTIATSALAAGAYTWSALACDGSGQCTRSASSTVTIP